MEEFDEGVVRGVPIPAANDAFLSPVDGNPGRAVGLLPQHLRFLEMEYAQKRGDRRKGDKEVMGAHATWRRVKVNEKTFIALGIQVKTGEATASGAPAYKGSRIKPGNLPLLFRRLHQSGLALRGTVRRVSDGMR